MPPPAVTVAVPSLLPLHKASVVAVIVAVNTGGCVIVTVATEVHNLKSVTVTVYVAAVTPLIFDTNIPLLQMYEYGKAPPVAPANALPSFPPLQLTFV